MRTTKRNGRPFVIHYGAARGGIEARRWHREDDAFRAHAIARRCTGIISVQHSLLYGVHYWAALALIPGRHDGRTDAERIDRWRQSFVIEAENKFNRAHEAVWQMALRHVRSVVDEAMALPTCIVW